MQAGFSGEPFYLDDFIIGNTLVSSVLDYTISPKNDLLLYPNPTSNNITWTFDKETAYYLRVFDISSRIVEEKQVNSLNITLNINGWAPGLYQLLLETENGVKTAKFVVE